MAGYAAMGRIERPRVVPRRAEADAAAGPGASWRIEDGPIDAREVVRAVGERLGDLRDELDRMTFFLLDPESWRG